MSDLNDIIRDQLQDSKDYNDNQKQLLATELQPVQTALVSLGSDKLQDLTNYAVKKVSKKAVDVLQNKFGIDLMNKKKQLTEKVQQLYESMDNRANDLMNQAENNISNTLSQGKNIINNTLNRFQGINDNIEEHIPSTINNFEEEGENELGSLLEVL